MEIYIRNYSPGKGELNLHQLFRRLTIKAFETNQECTYREVADKLGINVRTLYTMINYWDIETPRHRRDKLKKKNNVSS